MPSVQKFLETRRASITGRPANYEHLLLEPIADGLTANQSSTTFGSYVGWEQHHAGARRFYVAGMNWLTRETGLLYPTLIPFRDLGSDRLRDLCPEWLKLRAPGVNWKGEDLGKPQIAHAFKGEPMPFWKAAQVLMTIEYAVEQLLTKPRGNLRAPAGISRPEEVHSYMGIYPAVWNINDFSEAYFEQLATVYGDVVMPLKNAANLKNRDTVIDLTTGSTVSRETANLLHKYAVETFKANGLQPGDVRAAPGRVLGNGAATAAEEIEIG